MTRAEWVLVLLLLVGALSVVTARHEARKLFLDLQQVQKKGRDLEVDWERLLLSQGSWAMHGRVEKIASKHLGMENPGTARTRVLTPAEVSKAAEALATTTHARETYAGQRGTP